MPFDQKKVNGPETSFSYRQFIESKEDEKQKGFDKRNDGRKMSEHRKLAIQLNAISRAKGSCYIENGNTKIICGVFELREIPRSTRYADKGQLYCDFKYAPFSRDNRKSVGDTEEKLMSNSIKNALESVVCLHEFPNYQIDIFINVLEDDGSVLSTSIMAAGLAFVDASIPCFDIIASSSAAFIDGKILLDPNSREEEIVSSTNPNENHGTVTISSLDSIEQISNIMFSGHIDPELLIQAKKQLLEVNKEHVKYLKKVISLKIIKDNPEA